MNSNTYRQLQFSARLAGSKMAEEIANVHWLAWLDGFLESKDDAIGENSEEYVFEPQI